jgi:predicted acyl esterase
LKRLLPAAAAVLAVPGAAHAAPPSPFGHACTPQNGVRFCATVSDAQRVPSFDGVPIDVDVTLPPSGDGPFPAIVMLHGYGGSKRSFQATTPEGDGGSTYHYNDVYYAQQGYAVITPSARGFGRSCGVLDSRTPPACDRGWLHLADQRYEIRDTQYLLGLLADQGLVRPQAIGVTGVSTAVSRASRSGGCAIAFDSRMAATGLGGARAASR